MAVHPSKQKESQSAQEAAAGAKVNETGQTKRKEERVGPKGIADILEQSQMAGSLSTTANEVVEELEKSLEKATDGHCKIIQKRFKHKEVAIAYNDTHGDAVIIDFEEEADRTGTRTPITAYNDEVAAWMKNMSKDEVGINKRLHPSSDLMVMEEDLKDVKRLTSWLVSCLFNSRNISNQLSPDSFPSRGLIIDDRRDLVRAWYKQLFPTSVLPRDDLAFMVSVQDQNRSSSASGYSGGQMPPTEHPLLACTGFVDWILVNQAGQVVQAGSGQGSGYTPVVRLTSVFSPIQNAAFNALAIPIAVDLFCANWGFLKPYRMGKNSIDLSPLATDASGSTAAKFKNQQELDAFIGSALATPPRLAIDILQGQPMLPGLEKLLLWKTGNDRYDGVVEFFDTVDRVFGSNSGLDKANINRLKDIFESGGSPVLPIEGGWARSKSTKVDIRNLDYLNLVKQGNKPSDVSPLLSVVDRKFDDKVELYDRLGIEYKFLTHGAMMVIHPKVEQLLRNAINGRDWIQYRDRNMVGFGSQFEQNLVGMPSFQTTTPVGGGFGASPFGTQAPLSGIGFNTF